MNGIIIKVTTTTTRNARIHKQVISQNQKKTNLAHLISHNSSQLHENL